MAQLTASQKEFLASIGVKESEAFDASGMSRTIYQQIMKEQGFKIAYGVTPCTKGGHTLRTRKGHCAQCSPLAIVYMNRNDKSGYLYIAESAAKQLIKVGVTSNVHQREESLRFQGYGGAHDWLIEYQTKLDASAGAIEKEIHSKLKKFKVATTYWKDNKEQQAYEVFNCSFEEAYVVIQEVLNN